MAKIKVTLVTFISVIHLCQVAVGGGVDPGHRALQRRGGRRAGQGDADPHTGAHVHTVPRATCYTCTLCNVCHDT